MIGFILSASYTFSRSASHWHTIFAYEIFNVFFVLPLHREDEQQPSTSKTHPHRRRSTARRENSPLAGAVKADDDGKTEANDSKTLTSQSSLSVKPTKTSLGSREEEEDYDKEEEGEEGDDDEEDEDDDDDESGSSRTRSDDNEDDDGDESYDSKLSAKKSKVSALQTFFPMKAGEGEELGQGGGV